MFFQPQLKRLHHTKKDNSDAKGNNNDDEHDITF